MAESIGWGTELQRFTTEGVASSDPGVYTAVAQVFDVQGIELTRDDVEMTRYASADGYREYTPALREGGSLVLTMNLLRNEITQQYLFHSTAAGSSNGAQGTTNAVVGSFNSTDKVNWRLLHTTLHYWQWSGYVSRIVEAQPINDRRTWEATIKVDGVPKLGIISTA